MVIVVYICRLDKKIAELLSINRIIQNTMSYIAVNCYCRRHRSNSVLKVPNKYYESLITGFTSNYCCYKCNYNNITTVPLVYFFFSRGHCSHDFLSYLCLRKPLAFRKNSVKVIKENTIPIPRVVIPKNRIFNGRYG